MREQHADGSTDSLGLGNRPHVHLDAYVCASCGFTAWYTVAGELRTARSEGSGCDECGGAKVVPLGLLKEREPSHSSREMAVHAIGDCGELEASGCADCGRLRWKISLLAGAPLVSNERSCRWCGERLASAARPVEEYVLDWLLRDHLPLAIAFRPRGPLKQRIGFFMLEVCRACREADWIAHGQEHLREDPSQGVALHVGIHPVQSVRTVGGPYR